MLESLARAGWDFACAAVFSAYAWIHAYRQHPSDAKAAACWFEVFEPATLYVECCIEHYKWMHGVAVQSWLEPREWQ